MLALIISWLTDTAKDVFYIQGICTSMERFTLGTAIIQKVNEGINRV